MEITLAERACQCLLFANAVIRPVRKGVEHPAAVRLVLGVTKPSFRDELLRVSKVSFIVVRRILGDGDTGLFLRNLALVSA
jgi:hypothetical protein